ncbi:MAG TPA: hypothetical protein VER33_23460 [Polyangiaceae bacterium]|nr:hypothetical protein [Polyangiaceae bacterium]
MTPFKLVALLPAFALSVTTLGAHAEEGTNTDVHRFQLSLWNTLQTSDRTDSIHGVRLNLPYGSNRDVHGLDLGIVNHTTRDMHGAALGFAGYVQRDVRGLQSSFVLSIARGNVMGVQQGVYTSARNLSGVQSGAVNHVEGAAVGARFAAVNIAEGSSRGAELGIVNYARRMRGLQVGIVNVTDELHGVQIGVANIAKNGFLPFFPVVNAAM